MSDVLKKYSIVIGADTKALMEELNKAEKDLNKKLKNIDLGAGTRESIEKLREEIKTMQSDLRTATKDINNSISAINTDTLKGEFKGLQEVISSDVNALQERIADLQKTIDALNGAGFGGLETSIGKTLNSVSEQMGKIMSEFKDFHNFTQDLRVGAIDTTALNRSVESSSNLIEKETKKIKKNLRNALDLYDPNEVTKVISGDNLNVDEALKMFSVLKNIVNEYKKIGDTEFTSIVTDTFNGRFNIDVIKKQLKLLDDLISDELSDTKSRLGREQDIYLRWKTELDPSSTVEELLKKIEAYQSDVQKGIDKTPLKIKIDVDKSDFKNQIKNAIKEENDLLKSENSQKINVKISASDIEKNVNTTVSNNVNGSFNIKSEDLAQESTLSSIKDILSTWDKNGISAKSDDSSSATSTEKKIVQQAELNLKNARTLVKGWKFRGAGTQQEQVADFRQGLLNKREYEIARKSEIGNVTRILSKILANPEKIKDTSLYKDTVEVNGKQYAKWDPNNRTIDDFRNFLELEINNIINNITKDKQFLSDIKSSAGDKDKLKQTKTYNEFIEKDGVRYAKWDSKNRLLSDFQKYLDAEFKNIEIDKKPTEKLKTYFSDEKKHIDKWLKSNEENLNTVGVELYNSGELIKKLRNKLKNNKFSKGETREDVQKKLDEEVEKQGKILQRANLAIGKDDVYRAVYSKLSTEQKKALNGYVDDKGTYQTGLNEEYELLQIAQQKRKLMQEIVILNEKQQSKGLSENEQEVLDNKKEELKILLTKPKNQEEYNRLLKEELEIQEKINKKNATSEDVNKLMQIREDLSNILETPKDDMVEYAKANATAIEGQLSVIDKEIELQQKVVNEKIGKFKKAVVNMYESERTAKVEKYQNQDGVFYDEFSYNISSEKEYENAKKRLEVIKEEASVYQKSIIYNKDGKADYSALLSSEQQRFSALRKEAIVLQSQLELYDAIHKSSADVESSEEKSSKSLLDIIKNATNIKNLVYDIREHFGGLTENEILGKMSTSQLEAYSKKLGELSNGANVKNSTDTESIAKSYIDKRVKYIEQSIAYADEKIQEISSKGKNTDYWDKYKEQLIADKSVLETGKNNINIQKEMLSNLQKENKLTDEETAELKRVLDLRIKIEEVSKKIQELEEKSVASFGKRDQEKYKKYNEETKKNKDEILKLREELKQIDSKTPNGDTRRDEILSKIEELSFTKEKRAIINKNSLKAKSSVASRNAVAYEDAVNELYSLKSELDFSIKPKTSLLPYVEGLRNSLDKTLDEITSEYIKSYITNGIEGSSFRKVLDNIFNNSSSSLSESEKISDVKSRVDAQLKKRLEVSSVQKKEPEKQKTESVRSVNSEILKQKEKEEIITKNISELEEKISTIKEKSSYNTNQNYNDFIEKENEILERRKLLEESLNRINNINDEIYSKEEYIQRLKSGEIDNYISVKKNNGETVKLSELEESEKEKSRKTLIANAEKEITSLKKNQLNLQSEYNESLDENKKIIDDLLNEQSKIYSLDNSNISKSAKTRRKNNLLKESQSIETEFNNKLVQYKNIINSVGESDDALKLGDELLELKNKYIEVISNYLSYGGDKSSVSDLFYSIEKQTEDIVTKNRLELRETLSLKEQQKTALEITQTSIETLENKKKSIQEQNKINKAENAYLKTLEEEFKLANTAKKNRKDNSDVFSYTNTNRITKGMSDEQKFSSFKVDYQLNELTKLYDQQEKIKQSAGETSQEYVENANKIDIAKQRLTEYRNEAVELGLFISQVSGRAVLDSDKEATLLSKNTFTGIQESYARTKEQLDEFKANNKEARDEQLKAQKEEKELAKQIEQARYGVAKAEGAIAVEKKESNKADRFTANMTEEELQLRNELLNAQNALRNLTKKDSDATDEEVNKQKELVEDLKKRVELSERLELIHKKGTYFANLKNGYRQEQYQNGTASGKTNYSSIDPATEGTLSQIRDILVDKLGVTHKSSPKNQSTKTNKSNKSESNFDNELYKSIAKENGWLTKNGSVQKKYRSQAYLLMEDQSPGSTGYSKEKLDEFKKSIDKVTESKKKDTNVTKENTSAEKENSKAKSSNSQKNKSKSKTTESNNDLNIEKEKNEILNAREDLLKQKAEIEKILLERQKEEVSLSNEQVAKGHKQVRKEIEKNNQAVKENLTLLEQWRYKYNESTQNNRKILNDYMNVDIENALRQINGIKNPEPSKGILGEICYFSGKDTYERDYSRLEAMKEMLENIGYTLSKPEFSKDGGLLKSKIIPIDGKAISDLEKAKEILENIYIKSNKNDIPQDIIVDDNFVQETIDEVNKVRETIGKYGRETVQNYVNGMNLELPEVKKVAEELSNIPLKTIKDELDINSPSKVMEELGYWTGDGFAKGVYNSTDEVKAAIQELLKAGKITKQDVESLNNWDRIIDGKKFDARSKDWKFLSSALSNKDLFNLGSSNADKQYDVDSFNKAKEYVKNALGEGFKFSNNDLKEIGDKVGKSYKFSLEQLDKFVTEVLLDEYKDVLSKENKVKLNVENGRVDNKTLQLQANLTKRRLELEQRLGSVLENNAEIEQLITTYEKNLVTTKIKGYSESLSLLKSNNNTNQEYINQIDILENKINELQTLMSSPELSTEQWLNAKDLNSTIPKIINELNEINNNPNKKITNFGNIADANNIQQILLSMKGINKESVQIENSGKRIVGTINEGKGASKTLEFVWSDILGTYVQSTSVLKEQVSLWDRLKSEVVKSANYFKSYFSGYMITQKVFSEIRNGITYIKELDSALTEMKKVSDESTSSLERFQKQSFNVAKEIGTTAVEIQRSAADFMRLGYSLKEASQLAKDANIYANVGDMDIETATEHMISSIKAWESEFKNSTEASISLIDKYNEIGNNYAITSADIGSAMERSAAALKMAGNTVDESIGLITAGNLIQQDADTTANALKVMSLRIRGSKADLEEMGEETDNLADSTSKLRGEIKALTGVDIMFDEKTYKSTAAIIQEIGQNWDKLTDISKATTLEKLAGKTRASTVAGLIENYKTIEEVANDSANAQGSAMRENLEYMDSIEGRTAKLTTQVQEFWYSLISSDTVKVFISSLTDLLSLVTKVAEQLGSLGAIGSIFGAYATYKNFGRDKMSSQSLL